MLISAARAAAFEILMRVEATDAYASELLHSAKFSKLSSADHGLLTALVMGVLRWRGALDEEIARHIRQPLAKLDIEVLSALRLGAYQLLFLDRIPARAAINESVELVKRARKTSAAGMINAVLRKMSSHEPDSTAKEKQSNAVSYPEWLIKRWDRNYGKTTTQHICEYGQAEPQTAVRLGDSHSPQGTTELPNVQFGPGHLLARSAIVKAGDITRTPEFREHRLVVQDEASQLVAVLVAGGDNILDCCAAPGGKTRILAQENPDATVIAVELHPHRAALLRKLVAEPNVHIVSADACSMPFCTAFDRVLVDVPCSGTGTLARNPEIKWRLKPEDLLRLQQYQIGILQSALQQTVPGGQIIYSTCSLEPEENEQVVEKALAENSGFHVLDLRESMHELRRSGELAWPDIDSLLSGPYLRTIPGVHPCDGFFAALIARQS